MCFHTSDKALTVTARHRCVTTLRNRPTTLRNRPTTRAFPWKPSDHFYRRDVEHNTTQGATQCSKTMSNSSSPQ
jgi:hypothetical protein